MERVSTKLDQKERLSPHDKKLVEVVVQAIEKILLKAERNNLSLCVNCEQYDMHDPSQPSIEEYISEKVNIFSDLISFF